MLLRIVNRARAFLRRLVVHNPTEQQWTGDKRWGVLAYLIFWGVPVLAVLMGLLEWYFATH